MRNSLVATCVTALLFLLTWQSIAQAGPKKSVRDWEVYCENNLSCLASTYPDVKGFGSFGFSRDFKASAPVVLELYSYAKIKEASKIVLSIPGQLERYAISAPPRNPNISTTRITDEAVSSAILPALLAGQSMSIDIDTDEGPLSVKISLSGVTGAAIFMDEAQQRLGNKDALVKKGEGEPKDATSRVVELKSTESLPEPVSRLWKNGPDSCGETFDNVDLLAQYGGFRVDMENESALFILPCGYPGAYNYPYVSYGFDKKEKRARQVMYPTMGLKGPTVMDHAYNVDWDDGSSQLHAFAKGRGIGDCGLIHLWEFDGDANYGNFELLEQRRKDDCDGKNDSFPLVWPIK